MTIKFKIKSVDHNGFCGRENHPSDSDIGLTVTPVRLVTIVVSDDGEMYDEQPEREVLREAARNTDPKGEAYTQGHTVMQLWECVTGDGRFLDMMDFELELASAL